jgi:hypothetical protein
MTAPPRRAGRRATSACDFGDAVARVALVDALARDGLALLAVLEGRDLAEAVTQAAGLLATVLGQDLEETRDGSFVIARRVAKDRLISTVDPQTRHGHKTMAGGFDGHKGHVAVDPDSEVITATAVSAGNAGDAGTAERLIGDLFDKPTCATVEHDTVRAGEVGEGGTGSPEACVYGDNALLAAAVNLARLSVLGMASTPDRGWVATIG